MFKTLEFPGGIAPLAPLPGLCPGPTGGLKRSPDPSPDNFAPPISNSWLRPWSSKLKKSKFCIGRSYWLALIDRFEYFTSIFWWVCPRVISSKWNQPWVSEDGHHLWLFSIWVIGNCKGCKKLIEIKRINFYFGSYTPLSVKVLKELNTLESVLNGLDLWKI